MTFISASLRWNCRIILLSEEVSHNLPIFPWKLQTNQQRRRVLTSACIVSAASLHRNNTVAAIRCICIAAASSVLYAEKEQCGSDFRAANREGNGFLASDWLSREMHWNMAPLYVTACFVSRIRRTYRDLSRSIRLEIYFPTAKDKPDGLAIFVYGR